MTFLNVCIHYPRANVKPDILLLGLPDDIDFPQFKKDLKELLSAKPFGDEIGDEYGDHLDERMTTLQRKYPSFVYVRNELIHVLAGYE